MTTTLAKVESKVLHCLMFIAAILSALVARATDMTSVLGIIQKWLPGGQTTAAVISGVLLLLTKAPVLLATVTGWIKALKNAGASVVILAGSLLLASCHNVTPDQFLNAAVDCAKTNPEGDAALAQVETCLIGAIASNPAACLAGLVTEGHFAVDEVACIVAYVAQQQTTKLARSGASAQDLAVRNLAVSWLVQEHISIINSYPAATSARQW